MRRSLHRRILAAVLFLALCAAAGFAAVWVRSHSTPWAALMRLWGQFSYRAVAPYEGDILLPIPFYPQEHSLSCEAASLRMALAYRGIPVPESEVIAEIGTDPTPKTEQEGRIIWGDPDRGFVGSIDGRMFATGYGVHWGPVARAANRWRLAQAVQGWDATTLATQLRLGNPVIGWGYVGSGDPYEWETTDGKVVRTVFREHVFVINGFRGDVSSPEGFYFMDPIYGQRYEGADEFMRRWAIFGRSGVLIN